MSDVMNGSHIVPTVEAGVVNALAQECWQTSEDHGFHDDWKAAAFLEKLGLWLADSGYRLGEIDADLGLESEDGQRDVGEYVIQIAQMLRNNYLGTRLLLVITEISEAAEALRSEGADGLLNGGAGSANFQEELADAIIRIGDTNGIVRGIIGDRMLQKMAVNRDRPHKHGRQL